ncbi:MAG: Maf family protein [Oscillospiraceae bacterium]|nr:Maf family protein [Oscillospiraceae bacterium]
MKVILASASPRRQELMKSIFDEFECIPADIEEIVPSGISAEETAEFLSVKKAAHIAQDHRNDLVVGCDTVVVFDGRVYGKPADKDDARRMLTELSGNTHIVITGVCLFYGGKSMSFSEKTSVEFYPLSEKEINDYISTGAPMDKAGAYGIQDKHFLPVKSIKGDYFNVVGLPATRLKREAEKFINLLQ